MAFGDVLDSGSSTALNGASDMEFTLANGAPDAGDLIVVAFTLQPVATPVTPLVPATGWNALSEMVVSGDSAQMLWRYAQAGDPATYTFDGQGGHRIGYARFEGPFASTPAESIATGATSAASVSVTPTSGIPALLLGQVLHPTYVGGNLTTPTAPLNELDDGGVTSDTDPGGWLGYRVVTSTSGSYVLAVTLGLAGFYDWSMRGVIFAGDSGGPEPDPEPVPQPPPLDPGRAIIEIYTSPADSDRWDEALWDTGLWSAAEWVDISPWCVTADVVWGADRGDYGILAAVVAGSWLIETLDPERVLDPSNADSPFYPELVAGLPIRINHEAVTIRTGVVRRLTYQHAAKAGTISATDAVSILSIAKVPEDSILSDTLYARAADAIAAAGLDIPVRRDGHGGAFTDPPLAPNPVGDFSVWEVISHAALEVLHVPSINSVGELVFRSWANPVSAGFALTSPEMVDLEAWTDDVGLYSVVRVTDDTLPTPLIIERKATPTPRYGERVYERTEPTINAEAWADAILADRRDQSLRFIPGDVRPLDAASVRALAKRQIVEDITLQYPEADPDVSVSARIMGIRFRVWDETTEYPDNIRTRWRWRFVTTAAAVMPLVEDGSDPPEFLFNDDDATDPLYPDGVVGL